MVGVFEYEAAVVGLTRGLVDLRCSFNGNIFSHNIYIFSSLFHKNAKTNVLIL